jgi:NAD+ synthase (glutamine-hydrolysing)
MTKSNKLGFARIATACPKLRVADCKFNAAMHAKLIGEAEAGGVDVLIFPELSLTGYTCGDLFQQETLLDGAKDALGMILQASMGFRGLIFVGLPLVVDGQLFNCAAVLCDGKILGVVPKSFPPTYKEFYESRWFRPAASANSQWIDLLGRNVPFGTDLLFQSMDIEDLIVGAEICEDLWVPIPPSSFQALMGATVLVNLSASNEIIGKANYRRQLVSQQSGRCMAVYAYASCGVHESTTDVVFGGHCLIGENGAILTESKRFRRDSFLTVADVDLERLRIDRLRTNSFGDSLLNLGLSRQFRRLSYTCPRPAETRKLAREIEAHPFVPKGKDKLRERCEEIFNIQVAGLCKRLEHVNPSHVTIGVSGGLDSTLALLVTIKAFDLLGWSRDRIHGYTMPGFGTTSRTKVNAHALMKQLGITAKEVDIQILCMEEMHRMGHKPFGVIDIAAVKNRADCTYRDSRSWPTDIDGEPPTHDEFLIMFFREELAKLLAGAQDLVFENTQARMRTSILMNNGFQIGTGDLSELALGWCTYNADHMSGYNPDASIPKTLVKFLVRWAAEHQFDGPERATLMDIFATEISPELLPTGKDGKIQQKTESVVGPYELHDFFLYYTLRFGAKPEKIFFLAQQAKFDAQYSDAELLKWLRVFVTRFFSQQFKRSCLPDGPKVGSISLSPRGDWRMPSDAQAALWLEFIDQQLALIQPANPQPADAKANMTSTTPVAPRGKRALLRVDFLNGFMPLDAAIPGTGELPVPGAPELVPLANKLSQSTFFDLVVDCEDFHPEDHGSFFTMHEGKAQYDQIDLFGLTQVLWNPHCRQNTPGAQPYPTLDMSRVARAFKKGTDKTVDSYSGFWDNGKRKSTGLAEYLREQGVTEIYVIGVTRPFCPSYTATHGVDEGFATFLIKDACSTLEVAPGACDADLKALEAHGVKLIESASVLSPAK